MRIREATWSDCDGDVSTRFSDDYLITLASVYWFTNSIGTSFRPYYEFAAGFTTRVDRVNVPTALALFPRDLASPPRSWAVENVRSSALHNDAPWGTLRTTRGT